MVFGERQCVSGVIALKHGSIVIVFCEFGGLHTAQSCE